MHELTSPAAERNKEPILQILRDVLPASGLVLEVASGTGQHVAHFAKALPQLRWQPTDADDRVLGAITVRCRELSTVAAPRQLNVCDHDWSAERAEAMLCINMIHISPMTATTALLAGAGQTLATEAPLILYGPFKQNGQQTAASNEAFDANLRSRNPDWGIRNLDDVIAEAATYGLERASVHEMPANNLMVVLRKL